MCPAPTSIFSKGHTINKRNYPKRSSYLRSFTFVLFLILFLWILLQFIAPLAIPPGSTEDFSGIVIFSDNKGSIETFGFPWNLLYSSGDFLCHQKSERSIIINENQMPFCARCTAIWLGLVIGLGFIVLYTIQLDEKFIIALLIGLIPIGVDGFGQLIGLWESTNLTRIITGLLIGILCGIALGIIIDEIKTLKVFKFQKVVK